MEIFVLVPSLLTNDETIQYYCDFSESTEEFERAFKTLDLEWNWQPVTIDTYEEVIDDIQERQARTQNKIIVFNLCDGDEHNNVPGISVVQYLEKSRLIFTGARENFYQISSSKIDMKRAFDAAEVATPAWMILDKETEFALGVFEKIKGPLIVKPAVSAGSMGISTKSVVHSREELALQIEELKKGCHGWDATKGGLFIERFVAGREFTAFIVGSASHPQDAKIYAPVERVFDNSLDPSERILSFDRVWETKTPFCVYAPVDRDLGEKIKSLSWSAFASLSGTGYGRVDLRMCEESGELFVLEVNAQCGISDDDNSSSVGAILRLEQKSFIELIDQIIKNAVSEACC